MVTIIDYGAGNLFSLKSSMEYIGEKVTVSDDLKIIEKAERLVLPGVGAFRDAAEKLRMRGLDRLLMEKFSSGTPVMGICLGMQMLFEKSYEYGEHNGLGIIKGSVVSLKEVAKGLKIPHIGWNTLNFPAIKHPVFKYVSENEYAYFVHSYYAKAENEDSVIAYTDYGGAVTAAAAYKNAVGCQFHPEKSGETGLKILRGFCEWEGK